MVLLTIYVDVSEDHCHQQDWDLTAQAPATDATIPPEIIIGRRPLVHLNSMPLIAPAAMVLAASFFPLRYPMYELVQL